MGRLSHATDAAAGTLAQVAYSGHGAPTFYSGESQTPVASNNVTHPFLSQGRPYFEGLGAFSMGHRWYRPDMGRFLSPDPLGFVDGPNPFIFGGAQPMYFIDPDGLWKRASELMVVSLLGGAIGFSGLPIPGPDFGEDHEAAIEFFRAQIVGAGFGLTSDAALLSAGAPIAGGLGAALGCLGSFCAGSVPAAVGAYSTTAGIAAARMTMHGMSALQGAQGLREAERQYMLSEKKGGGDGGASPEQGGTAGASPAPASRGVPTLSKALPNLSKVDAQVVSRAAELAKGGTRFADDLAALSRSTSEVVGSHAKVHLLGHHGGRAVYGSARSGIGIVASEQGTLLVRAPRGGAVEVLGLFR